MNNFKRKSFLFFSKHTNADESTFESGAVFDIDCCSPENFGDND